MRPFLNYAASLFLLIAFAIATAAQLAHSQPSAPSSQAAAQLEERRQQLKSLIDEYWQHNLEASPETATFIGDARYNDRLSDLSFKAIEEELAVTKAYAARLEKIDITGFPKQEQLNKTLLLRQLKDEIESIRLKQYEMPVDQMNGLHLELAELPGGTRFAAVKDYEDYLKRLHQVPRALDQLTTLMRMGMKDGLIPPKYLLEKVPAQADAIAVTGEKSPFAAPVFQFPKDISAADQARLRSAALELIADEIVPAYKKFSQFVRVEYAPKGRLEPGIWALPNGREIYQYDIHTQTTTDLDPETIHQLGLKQVSELEASMLEVAHLQGFKDLGSFNESIRKNKALYGTSGQQILDLYQHYADQMTAKLPELFGTLPKNKLVVVPMEAFRAPNEVPADYSAGDGKRPGRINVNEYDPTHRLLLNVEAIAYHEGVPGHHLQISISQELTGLPAFRRFGGYNAYSEGWALYSERLGKEIGFYQDPYSEYGRLGNEMWRSVRLVVDTGVHYKHWTRQQMVDFFHQHTAMDEPNIETEVDRYIAWPGQALGYKLGQMKILELRQKAQQQLGAKFDLRAFHDAVLTDGALPLDVLDSRLTQWIEAQKQAAR